LSFLLGWDGEWSEKASKENQSSDRVFPKPHTLTQASKDILDCSPIVKIALFYFSH
jgi:hypothetical protein